jgi:hypothetical protein
MIIIFFFYIYVFVLFLFVCVFVACFCFQVLGGLGVFFGLRIDPATRVDYSEFDRKRMPVAYEYRGIQVQLQRSRWCTLFKISLKASTHLP